MIEGDNALVLEKVIESFKHFINNEPGYFTCPIGQWFLAIDITLRKSDLGTLTLREILEEFLALSKSRLYTIAIRKNRYRLISAKY